jgi:D-alanyl-lipoteichoic acid acyltransferase DltB (MBOAT superfamily)
VDDGGSSNGLKPVKNTRLLLASLFFYAWGEPAYILVMLLSIAINYLFGLAIYAARTKSGMAAKLVLWAGILGNLGILYYFKYLNFRCCIIKPINRICPHRGYCVGRLNKRIIIPC